jgi:flagellar motility protein MotE (MotC chaperone)
MSTATISVDEFQALEQKVLQTVELIKKEREARASAEAERDAAQSEIDSLRQKLASAESGAQQQVEHLEREREAVRERVGKMLANLDELL